MAESGSIRMVQGACPHDCPDTCAWQVAVEDGRAVGLRGDPAHPFTRGTLCAKVNHYIERAQSDERLRHPLRRAGPKGTGQFERVSWDEALDDIASRLKAIVAADGGAAVLPYSYLGTQGIVQCNSISQRFFHRIGATRLVRAICGGTAGAGVTATNGVSMGIMPEDIVHSRHIILWGTNTVVTNVHLWPFIREARQAGARVVVIDPARTRTAEQADWHIRPRPGTDAALALGMMHVIVRNRLHDADYVERHTVGFEQLTARIADYPPERVAEITGVDAKDVEALATAYATTRPSVIRTLVGLEHHAHGGMTYRTISCLPALVGAWRDLGGGLLHMVSRLRALALNMDSVEMPQLEDRNIRKVNMVQLGRALTDDAMSPPIRALFVYNSNPAATTPHQNLVLQGLRRQDLFTVVVEQFMTDTARHADYVLPATSQLEHFDLFWSWGQPYVTVNLPAIAPLGESLPNTEIFRRLAARMGFQEPYFQDSDEDIARLTLSSSHPLMEGITLESLRQQGWARFKVPEGFRPYADGGFPTSSGRCEFYSEGLAQQGLDPLPGYQPAPESPHHASQLRERYPLSLMAAKSALHFLNSSYGNMPRQLKAEKEPLADIHPDDANHRGIATGDMVRVFNDRGSLTLRARVGDRVVPGMVAMPSGWWATLSPGGSSANALTGDGLSDMGFGGDFHDTLVEVERLT
jgi:anaerobic selenocysteine-containing dehydrogenase